MTMTYVLCANINITVANDKNDKYNKQQCKHGCLIKKRIICAVKYAALRFFNKINNML